MAKDQAAHVPYLIERVGMINRIHTALRSTLNLEDIHSIVLATLVSTTGLNFSRAMLLDYDSNRGVLRGLATLAASNRQQHNRIRREIAEEEATLASMVKDLAALEPSEEEQEFFSKSLAELSSHSFWITIYQKFSDDPSMIDRVRGIEFPIPDKGAGKGKKSTGGLLDEILRAEGARIIQRNELEGSNLPLELVELLAEESLWAAIRTQKGVRLLLIADKFFQDEPVTQMDRLHLDWFVGQVALALENAEMYHDLEQTYESLKELDSMKSNFLATISHELRTPLTAIMGYVQLLVGNRVGPLSPGQREVLERILNHSDMLTVKVNDLLEIAELDSGRAVEVDLESVDPLNALMTILPRIEQRRAQKGISIQPIVESPIPLVRSNTESLERIFYHLLDNAVKFGKPGGSIVIQFDAQDGELIVRVADSGIGISEEQLHNIFEAFYQIDNRLTRHYEGMGIGLAIIKRQLAVTGGRIEVRSEVDKGSTFSVIYPIVPAV